MFASLFPHPALSRKGRGLDGRGLDFRVFDTHPALSPKQTGAAA
jgi:hypothetical protein